MFWKAFVDPPVQLRAASEPLAGAAVCKGFVQGGAFSVRSGDDVSDRLHFCGVWFL